MAIDINIPSQVKTFANLAAFPVTGSLKTIFIAEDTNKTYRWTGSVYVEISASQAAAWGTITGTLSTQTDLNTALSGKVPTTRTLTINGTTQDLSADRTFTISTGITIGTTAIASGTVGRVLFEGTGNVVQESANISWDNTLNRLYVQAPFTGSITTRSLYWQADSGLATTGSRSLLTIGLDNPRTSGIGVITISNNGYEQGLTFHTASGGTGQVSYPSGSEAMRITNTRNILINTTTDAGFKLDVNGTARVSDNLLLTNGIIATSTATTRLQSSLNYFTHNRIGSSGALGFKIAVAGTDVAFWRRDDGSGDVEFGNVTDNGIAFYGNNLSRAKMWRTGQWIFGNGTTYVASALVAMESTTTGFLPPRMTTTQKNAIATPATGLQIYDSTLNRPCFYDGTSWITL